MEIEHINENTIRVRIRDEDLEARGFRFLDLLGNQKQIESFFYSILEEVDLDNEFQQSDAVTFQVMPSRNGLELYISKDQEMHENLFTNNYFDGQEDSQSAENDASQFEKIQEAYSAETEESLEEEGKNIIIKFQVFEELIQMARGFKLEDDCESLYLFNKEYYLVIDAVDDGYDYIKPQEKEAVLLEFGQKSEVTSEFIGEHGKLIIKDNALQEIVKYFGAESEDEEHLLF